MDNPNDVPFDETAGAGNRRGFFALPARRMILTLILVGVLAYGGVVVLAWLFHPRMIFIPTYPLYRTPQSAGWTFEEVRVPVADETTCGWYVPVENARGVVLFSHGNAGNIADRIESIGLLRSFGFSVLAYDYGGYGLSTGRPSEPRCYADIRAMWRWLVETRGVPSRKIVLFGRSLGGGVTADLAAEVRPAAVILESTFLSTVDIAREIVPWLPMSWIVRPRFANRDKVGRIQAPVLFIHSPDDRTIPFHHGQELFRLAPEPKQFLEISGDHNEGFVQSYAVYREGWEDFLGPILPRAR